MYEDLEQIAQLRFGREVEAISRQTREKVTAIESEYAARAPFAGARSGPHEAAVAAAYICGAEQQARALCEIWLDLIKRRKGCISLSEAGLISAKVEGYARAQQLQLRKLFSARRMGPAALSLTQRAETQMRAVAIEVNRDLQIIARENQALPTSLHQETGDKMDHQTRRRFSPGRRVLVGHGLKPGTIASVDDLPTTLGEYRHIVTLDREAEAIPVLGCNIQPIPELDEDISLLRGGTVHGDQIFNYGSAGAVGRGAHGTLTISDRSTHVAKGVDLRLLAVQLETLRHEYRQRASSREDDKQLSLLAEAAEAAEKGENEGLASVLSRLSQSVLGVAREIGTDVAAKVIAEMLKQP